MATSYRGADDGFPVYTVALPEDSRLPRRGPTDTVPSQGGEASARQLLFSERDQPRSDEEREVWFRWVVGHQHLFLYWIVQGEICRRATRAWRTGDADRAARLLHVAAALRWGEIAAMLNCGELPPDDYQAFLRPKMELVRADFSARSAQDYLVFETALSELRKDLRTLKDVPAPLAQARLAFQKANTRWKELHIEVAERLQPGVSLAVMEFQRLRDQGLGMSFPQYVDDVIQSKAAMAQYDDFFGVRRVPVSAEQFAETAVWVLNQAHRILALPREQLRWVLRGDHLVLAIIGSSLRPQAARRAS
jgi:hypothetical protein